MTEKSGKPKKLGRREVLRPDQLLDRYKALKLFFESEWGRIGLDLRKVRQVDDVRRVLKSVPGIEWCRPFSDQPARCLIADGSIEAGPNELSRTRQEHEEAENYLSKLWPEYHCTHQELDTSRTALKSLFPELALMSSAFPLFLVAYVLARELNLEDLTIKCSELDKTLPLAQKKVAELREQLLFKEGWYARDQICKFALNKRYEKTATNFARATAGMPEYGWLHSLRKCPALNDESLSYTNLNYQIFDTIRMIVQKMRKVNVQRTGMRLKKELLRDDCDPMLRAFISRNWAYMEQAFAECRGKGFKRSDLPYKIMGRYLAHVERPKTPAETELAKRNQLVPDIK
jgi:hypothetical protein